MRGPDLYRALASGTREVFPDASFTIEDTVASGSTVAVRWTMTGTHEGSMFGEDPTGREVTLPAIEFDRFEDGLLLETWVQSDMLGLEEQLEA
jgi:predicted ester cyclase